MKQYDKIPTPAAVICLDAAYRNVKKLVEENKKHGIKARPHVKVHKCSWLAKKEIGLGAAGITCAKLSEAEVMAEAGVQNILVAFPLIGEDKWERYAKLSRKTETLTIVNSRFGAEGLSRWGEKEDGPFRVLIEVDGGINRGGVQPGQAALEFAREIGGLKGIEICGLMYYGGAIYSEDTEEKIRRAARKERDDLVETGKLLTANGFCMEILSGGSSFSGKFPDCLEGITEVRSGNFIFNDCAQLPIGLVSEEDCALRVISTVVAKPDSSHAIIDAGSKSLTSDTALFRQGYGYIVGHPEVRVYKLNEEHGFLECEEGVPFEIGDKIAIIPNHACVITNINEQVFGVEKDGTLIRLDIDCRAKNY